MTDDDKAKAARHTRTASEELDRAADSVDNDIQATHLEEQAEEARLTAEELEDQARSE